MAILKKIQASTLMETLVATVLLIVIFTVASLTTHQLFGNTVTYDIHAVTTHLYELEYRYRNRQLQLPYTETYRNWTIAVSSGTEHNTACVTLEAVNTQTQKTVTQIIITHAETP